VDLHSLLSQSEAGDCGSCARCAAHADPFRFPQIASNTSILREYDILSCHPTNEKAMQLACTDLSNPGPNQVSLAPGRIPVVRVLDLGMELTRLVIDHHAAAA
jgi:hypothetical protein